MTALSDAGDDIVHLQGGIRGQNDISKEAIILQPGVLRDHTLYLRVYGGLHYLITAVPAGSAAGCIGPDHMYLGTALFFGYGVGILHELIFSSCLDSTSTPEGNRRVKDGSMDESLGDKLLTPGYRRNPMGFKQPLCRGRLGKVLKHAHMTLTLAPYYVSGHPLIGYLGLMNSRFSQSLHP